jgi:hypothetical protein
MAPFHVWWDCFVLALVCVYKRTVFCLFPDERRRDLELVTASYNLDEEGKKKFLFWRNHQESTFANFHFGCKNDGRI